MKKKCSFNVHGRPAMIVYTSICRPVSEYPAKTFRFLMEIMSGLKQVCMAETVLSPFAQLTLVMKFKPTIVDCLF